MGKCIDILKYTKTVTTTHHRVHVFDMTDFKRAQVNTNRLIQKFQPLKVLIRTEMVLGVHP